MGRFHKKRDRDYNTMSRMVANRNINLSEYKELWNIYKLRADVEGDAPDQSLTAGDYVQKIFGNLADGNNIVYNYLVQAEEFVDPVTKESGKLRLKNNGIPVIGDPDVDSFFPKFLWKGFLQTYTPQIIEKQRAVYFLCKGDPIYDEATGEITFTDMFLLYHSQDNRNQGTHKQTKITLSYLDSNVAKDNNGAYVDMHFFLKPAQPSNVKYIEFTPKTNVILAPYSFIVNASGEEKVPTIVKDKSGLSNWELIFPRFKKVSDAAFEIKEVMWSEFKYMRELRKSLKPSKDWNSIPGVVEAGQGLGEASPIFDGNYPTSNRNDYNFFTVMETVMFGASNIEDSFLDHLTTYWRAGGADSNLTQYPIDTVWSDDKDWAGLDNRDTANWKGNSSYFLGDIYRNKNSFLGAVARSDNVAIYESKVAFDEDARKELFISLLKGDGQVNGLLFDTRIPSVIEETLVGDIELLEDESYAIVNCMGNIDTVLDDFSWDYNSYVAAKASRGDTRFILPDPKQTFPQGGINMDRELFRDSNYSETKFVESKLLLEIGGSDSYELNSFELGMIGGTSNIRYLDKDLNPAVGINADGEEIILPSIELASPQRYAPMSGRIKITYL